MKNVILIDEQEFWERHEALTRNILRDEIMSVKGNNLPTEEILVLEDICKLLKKSKQTIYNWMDANIIKGHYINESLFFLRSEILDLLKKDNKEIKK